MSFRSTDINCTAFIYDELTEGIFYVLSIIHFTNKRGVIFIYYPIIEVWARVRVCILAQ